MSAETPAARRVLASLGTPELMQQLAQLPASEMTSLLLAVMRQRSERVEAPDLVRRYRHDRFVTPSPVPFFALRKVEDGFLAALTTDWEVVALSPLVPFATHAATGHVSQNRVVSTVRASEVAADPTNALALEAAVRRRASRPGVVRLATVQRVVRAQNYGAGQLSHFSLFALVTAGRDTGDHEFETSALAEHIALHVAGVRAAGARRIHVLLTDWTEGGREQALQRVEHRYSDDPDVVVSRDPGRTDGLGYYENLSFKVDASFGVDDFEVSDGGFTRWMASLLADRKERLCISGSGLDRLGAETNDVTETRG